MAANVRPPVFLTEAQTTTSEDNRRWNASITPPSLTPPSLASSPYHVTAHRSAPTLTPYLRGHGAIDPLRGLRNWSAGGTFKYAHSDPWSKHTASSKQKTATFNQREPPAWRPPGPSEGRAVPAEHRRPPPPPPPKAPPPENPPPNDVATNMLAEELRKTAGILSKAQAQMQEERNVSDMRAEEAEAQLAIATEMGRQEERHKAHAMVAEARGTLSALVDAHERGAAFVKQEERQMLANALAEQRRGLEAEITESRQTTESEQAELRHQLEERHRRDIDKLNLQVLQERRAKEEAEANAQRLQKSLEQTTEGRIESYYQKAVRRLQKVGLTRAWSAWAEMHQHKLYTKQLLRQTKGSFFTIMPTVPTAFALWHVRCEDP